MAYRDFILADDPWVYVEFEESTGPYAQSAGAWPAFPATNQSSLIRVPGIESGHYGLGIRGTEGGTDSRFVAVPEGFTYGLGDFSISFWASLHFQASAITGINLVSLIWKTSAGGNSDFSIRLFAGGELGANIYTVSGSTGTNTYLAATRSIFGSGWHHIGMIRRGTTLTMYVDGAPAGQKACPPDPVRWSSGNALNLGNVGGFTNVPSFSRDIDEFALFRYALSDAQMARHYQAGVGAVGMGVLAGSAKRTDGQPATSVVVRRWDTHRTMKVITPGSDGSWSLSVPAGDYEVTATGPSGYQPITHGPVTVG